MKLKARMGAAASLVTIALLWMLGQFNVVAAILRLRDHHMAASRLDRDRFRRLYLKLTHYPPLGCPTAAPPQPYTARNLRAWSY
jgi:hypothetical protein